MVDSVDADAANHSRKPKDLLIYLMQWQSYAEGYVNVPSNPMNMYVYDAVFYAGSR